MSNTHNNASADPEFQGMVDAFNGKAKPTAVDPEFQGMVDAYNGKVKPAGEVNPPKAEDMKVTENDLIAAAALTMRAPAGSTPEQLKHFEELRKIAVGKEGGKNGN